MTNFEKFRNNLTMRNILEYILLCHPGCAGCPVFSRCDHYESGYYPYCEKMVFKWLTEEADE